MRKVSVLLCLFMTSLVSMGQGISEKDDVLTASLDEVLINGLSDKTIIKKAINNLPGKSKKDKLIYGNGQIIQTIECDGKPVQLSREYGYYMTNGGNTKDILRMNFISVYNARSLRYTSSGKDVLPANYLNYYYKGNGESGSFNARMKYMFDIMRVIYLYGPIYSRNYSDYNYTLEKETEKYYRFRFESSDRYPDKNPLYAKGYLEIDASSMALKSFHIENMGIHLAGLYGKDYYLYSMHKKGYEYYNDDRYKSDCIDCDFTIDSHGEIQYAMIHLPWNTAISQYYKPGCGNIPRLDAVESNCFVTECWQAEQAKVLSKKEIKEAAGDSISNMAVKLVEKLVEKFYRISNSDPQLNEYNQSAIDKIKWSLDVSDVERQLNKNKPIIQQYVLQSHDYYDEMAERKAIGDTANCVFYPPTPSQFLILLKEICFDDPMGKKKVE